ncbi:MAG: hypothetical protein U0518_01520 [Candidatus Gracilibacteria bacterium]
MVQAQFTAGVTSGVILSTQSFVVDAGTSDFTVTADVRADAASGSFQLADCISCNW